MDNRNNIYVDLPKFKKPNIPNMGAMFRNYCENSQQELEQSTELLITISNEVLELKKENKSLKTEVKKLQNGRFISIVVPFIGFVISVASFVVALLQYLS